MNTKADEVNFDGIVGQTHNYSGLSYGNIASTANQYALSNPREAALQGLNKMKSLSELGIKQAVLPPHERPHLPSLRALGFTGTNAEAISAAFKTSPELLFAVSSAAGMWTANAATVTPSADTIDNHVHFTAANLTSKFHRSIESFFTERILKEIFKDPTHFIHHSPLPRSEYFSDEGAANHCRFCKSYGESGINLFVYGKKSLNSKTSLPTLFPARHSLEAVQAIARLHTLKPQHTIFAQQHPDAIDAGAFHNDVVSFCNKNTFLFHQNAFLNQPAIIDAIKNRMSSIGIDPIFIEVPANLISLQEAISTYLFNSQLISLPSGEMALIAPNECQDNPRTKAFLENLINNKLNSPIKSLHFLDLRQSMQNGGGPACLRLRVALNPTELASAHQSVFFTPQLYDQLCTWVKQHYRDRLHPSDLADPQMLLEVHHALDDLTQILKLGSIYDFQTSY